MTLSNRLIILSSLCLSLLFSLSIFSDDSTLDQNDPERKHHCCRPVCCKRGRTGATGATGRTGATGATGATGGDFTSEDYFLACLDSDEFDPIILAPNTAVPVPFDQFAPVNGWTHPDDVTFVVPESGVYLVTYSVEILVFAQEPDTSSVGVAKVSLLVDDEVLSCSTSAEGLINLSGVETFSKTILIGANEGEEITLQVLLSGTPPGGTIVSLSNVGGDPITPAASLAVIRVA